MLEKVVVVDTSTLFRKTARSPEGNVDVEPPSSMDDSSMILTEIGVDVEKGPRPNMMIRDGAQSLDEPRWLIKSTTNMSTPQLVCSLAIGPFPIT